MRDDPTAIHRSMVFKRTVTAHSQSEFRPQQLARRHFGDRNLVPSLSITLTLSILTLSTSYFLRLIQLTERM